MRTVILILVVMGPLMSILRAAREFESFSGPRAGEAKEKIDKCQNAVGSCCKILRTFRNAKDV